MREIGTARIIDGLLRKASRIDTASIPSFSAWKRAFDLDAAGWDEPVDRAIIGGFLADRVAYAFASGYEAAIQRLVPGLPRGVVASFCVTEDGGAHPASIVSSLSRASESSGEWRLNGVKRFITLANEADILLVAASIGTAADGKNIIRIARVPAGADGLSIAQMNNIPFVPEISHGSAIFNDTPIPAEDILPEDGYRRYIRPFRTIEDIHVTAAIAAFLFRCAAIFAWPRPERERITAFLALARCLALEDPEKPALHLALAGMAAEFETILEMIEPCWESADEETRARWKRDRALLSVAARARGRRTETAWAVYEGSTREGDPPA